MELVTESGAELVKKAIIEGCADAIFHALHEEDVVSIMQHEQTMIGSDGSLTAPFEGHPHPRWYGTFPRILGKYVREDGVLELRSEEHTSELQSRGHLVCRLLLEKKTK